MQMPLKSLRMFINVALLALLAMPGFSAHAKTYKWVDENGVTHYGDSIPPEYRDRANIEMNKRGVILKKNDPALSPEDRKARDAALAKQRKQDAEQKRKYTILLNTYSSVEEIDLARDRNLQLTEVIIKNIQEQKKAVQTELDARRDLATAYTQVKQPVPDGLHQDIATLEQNKQDLETAIAEKRKAVDEIRTRFDADKKRYVELTEAASASQ
jgi:hypothetical protein